MVWAVFLAEAKLSKSGALTKTVVFSFYKFGFTSLKHGRGNPLQRKGKFDRIWFPWFLDLGMSLWSQVNHDSAKFPKFGESHLGSGGHSKHSQSSSERTQKNPCFMTDSGHIENFFKGPKARQWKPQNYPDLPVPNIFGTNPPVCQ